MNDDEDRIREEAHRLWEGEGRPDGRADRHWAEAREIIALRDSNQTTLKPLKDTLDDPDEPALATASLGDLPGLTDQGDEVLTPSLDAAREIADETPLVTDKQEKASGKSKAKASTSKKDAPAAAKTAGKAASKGKGKSASV